MFKRSIVFIFSWALSSFFIVEGIINAFDSIFAGLCLFVIAVIFMPTIKNIHIFKKEFKFILIGRIFLSLPILFIYGLAIVDPINEKKEREQTVKMQKEDADYFNKNKESIITNTKNALAKKDYKTALDISNKYIVSHDKELEKLNSTAIEKTNEIKTEILLKEVKSTNKEDYIAYIKLYNELATINPNNKDYKTKINFYTQKIEDVKRRAAVKAGRKQFIEDQFSSYDGSHYELERIIKKTMNDPDSYKHVETVYWDKGDHLIVKTTFRGKNSFGAVVINTVEAKVSLSGKVISILE